jgi:hypothetical protein
MSSINIIINNNNDDKGFIKVVLIDVIFQQVKEYLDHSRADINRLGLELGLGLVFGSGLVLG